jgi:prepilin-type N-terminal cleavage/methylation domain-containing protein
MKKSIFNQRSNLQTFASSIAKSPNRLSAQSFSAAFTLVEVLLVIVVIGIALAVVSPSLVRSIRGQRLNSAARTMATVTRYARSMAVLKQSDLKLTFNLANGQIDVVSSNASLPSFSRVVEDVRIAEVIIEGQDAVGDGTCAIPFRRNGICTPFTVKIEDARGEYVMMSVDSLGSVKTKASGTQ